MPLHHTIAAVQNTAKKVALSFTDVPGFIMTLLQMTEIPRHPERYRCAAP